MMGYKIPDPSDFGISPQYGFLSTQTPLTSFAHPSFRPWDDLIDDLPSLIQRDRLVDEVSQLPLLSTQNLETELDYHRAYVVLGFLIHGYVWQHHSQNKTRERIPKQLAEPFVAVCDHIGLRPVLSYAGLCIWNWRLVDSNGGMEIDNMQALTTFTGTHGEEAVYLVPILVECEGGQLMHALLDAARAVQDGSQRVDEIIVGALRQTTAALPRMGKQLDKLYSRLDSEFFYHEHRPFMAGGQGLKRGIVLERQDGDETEAKFAGGSAVQSALFPFLDSILGVVHDEDGTLFQDMRTYMPASHRRFLEQVSLVPSLRSHVQNHQQNSKLVDAYNECLQALRSWRVKHIALVSKYIVQPARAAAKKAQLNQIEVNGSNGDNGEWELQGTGGSALMPVLRQARDDTRPIV